MPSDPQYVARRFYVLASIVVVTGILYLAQDLLIPVALAIFLTFLLAPLATRLERLGLGKVPGALTSIALAMVVILALGFVVTDQLISLADSLPEYEDNIRSKAESLQAASTRILGRTTRSIRGFTEPLSSGEAATVPANGAKLSDSERVRRMHARQMLQVPGDDPAVLQEDPADLQDATAGGTDESAEAVPVRVVESPDGPLSYVGAYASALLAPLATAGVVAVLAIFLLIQRRDVRDRIITLTGRGQVLVTTQAFDEMTRRISRYLLMQLVVNAAYAVPVVVGLALFGIPNALLWGLMGLVLRFIPYVGAWFTAGVSVLLAVAVLPGWWGPLGVMFFFVVLELFINNVIEPWLYSVGTGVSVLGVIFSAVFWGWIWGPVGLILATPIAVCLTVMGRHIPQLHFFDILLGGQATLEPKLRFFQRLLAMDQEEALEIAEEYRKANSLLGLYDDLIVPALQMAEQERHRGVIDEQRQAALTIAFQEIVDLAARADEAERAAADAEDAAAPGGSGARAVPGASTAIPVALASTVRIMCLPAGDEADELAGLMLEHLLRAQGYQVQTAAVESLSSELLAEVESSSAHIVVISALPPGALVAARYLCKRVASRWPQIPIVVGLWNAVGNVAHARERLESCGKSKVVTSYAGALVETARLAQSVQFVS